MKCPDCGTILLCPCKSCTKWQTTHPKEGVPYIQLGNDIRQCPVCKLIAHVDWWKTQEYKQYWDNVKEKVDEQ